MKGLDVALEAVTAGDLDGLPIVTSADHSDLLKTSAALPRLTISRSALVGLLTAWSSGRYTADEVQRWASFVRRGYCSGHTSGALHPLDIVYDARHEELIAEIIGRLDEIGDLIDRNIDDGQRGELLRRLEASSAAD